MRVAGAPEAQALRPVSWSADGRWLALEDPEAGRLHLLGSPDAAPAPLAPDDAWADGRYRCLEWSPTGSWAALVDASSKVWSCEPPHESRIVGALARARSRPSPVEAGQLAFSPDGRRLAWVTAERRVATLGLGADTPVIHSDVRADEIVWSPDSGALLTYSTHEHPPVRGARYGVLRVPEGRWAKLMDAPTSLPDTAQWSPDGALIALNLAHCSMSDSIIQPAGPTHRSELVVFDQEGHTRSTIAFGMARVPHLQLANYQEPAIVQEYAWHPDGSSLLTAEGGRLIRRSLSEPQEAKVVRERFDGFRRWGGPRCGLGTSEGALLFIDFETSQMDPWSTRVPGADRGGAFAAELMREPGPTGRVLCRAAAGRDDRTGAVLMSHEWYLWEPEPAKLRHLDFAAAQAGAAQPSRKPHDVAWLPGGRLLLKRGETYAVARSGPVRAAVYDLASGQVTAVPGTAEAWVTRPGTGGT